jgi:hypothetical protein
MPTRSGREYLLNQTTSHRCSVAPNHINTSEHDRGSNNAGLRTVLVVYAVSETKYTKLLLEGIYDTDKQILQHSDYYSIVSPMKLLVKQMMNGKSRTQCIALVEVIKRQDTDIYLRGSDGLDLAVGHTQSELEASVKQFTIVTLSNACL